MLNYVGDGEILNIVPLVALTSGVPKLIGGLFVVPQADIAANTLGAVVNGGEFTAPKATGFVPAVGDVAYWDIADAEFNSDTANTPVGHYTVAAATGDTVCQVKLLPTPVASVASLDTRLDTLEAASVVKQMAADGTQVAMSASDTYVNFTADALSLAANTVADNDTVEWELEVFLDAMNAALLVTLDLLVGALSLDTVAITTGDTNDWAKLKGTARCTAIGASSTWQIAGGEGCNSDGGSVTRDTPTLTTGTGPATTSAVVFTPRIKAATGNAGNLATIRNFKIKHHKTFAV